MCSSDLAVFFVLLFVLAFAGCDFFVVVDFFLFVSASAFSAPLETSFFTYIASYIAKTCLPIVVTVCLPNIQELVATAGL